MNIRVILPVIYYGQGQELLYQLLIMDKGEYSIDYSESCKVSTQINIRYTLPVIHYGQGWVLHRLFRILQGEYTTIVLGLLYQLFLIGKGEYSTDYS